MFFVFLSDLLVECFTDCCHLEVAHTVESLQSVFQQQLYKKQLPVHKSWSQCGDSPGEAVLWCSDIMHIMQTKSAFLWDYTGHCVSERGRKGGREPQRGLEFQRWIDWLTDGFTQLNKVCLLYMQGLLIKTREGGKHLQDQDKPISSSSLNFDGVISTCLLHDSKIVFSV